ncbi:MAG: DUF4397 domain-containing protein [Bacillota bacterium]|nr:DUF4397 domain-containing protein [Bacillota bacterium]
MYTCPYSGYFRVLPKSYIRILHASPNAPAVDIYANGRIIARNVHYKEFTNYLALIPGNYRITVYVSGTSTNPVINTNVTIPEKMIFTVAAIGTSPNLSLLPIAEPVLPIRPGKAYVRFAHLSPNTPAVDITLPNGDKIFKNVSYKEVTDYLPVNGGSYILQARIANTDNIVLHAGRINLRPGRFYTVYAVGLNNDTPPLQVLVPLDGNSYIRV